MKEIKLKPSDFAKYDRNMTIGELITKLKEDRPYVCPKCKGKGEIWIEEQENYAMGGSHPKSHWSECDICNGYGRTKNEIKPIYKLAGYEKVQN